MRTQGLRGIHVFWIITLFFTVVVGVDTMFIVRAVGTFPGEQVKNSYVLGLDYNREAESQAKQAKLGWSVQAGVQGKEQKRLVVFFVDRNEGPVTGLKVSATYFVVGAGNDEHDLTLNEDQPGKYSAPIEMIGRRAEFSIVARRNSSGPVVFEAGKTVELP